MKICLTKWKYLIITICHLIDIFTLNTILIYRANFINKSSKERLKNYLAICDHMDRLSVVSLLLQFLNVNLRLLLLTYGLAICRSPYHLDPPGAPKYKSGLAMRSPGQP